MPGAGLIASGVYVDSRGPPRVQEDMHSHYCLKDEKTKVEPELWHCTTWLAGAEPTPGFL